MDADLLMQTVAEVLKQIAEYSISNRADFEALVKKALPYSRPTGQRNSRNVSRESQRGKSAVAAAYRAGEKITNEFDGMTHDYTHKGGVVHTEILLPDHAPAEYADRAVLWNEVEKIEKAKNAQLAREIEIALPRELTREQGISLVREYVKRHFVAGGMGAALQSGIGAVRTPGAYRPPQL